MDELLRDLEKKIPEQEGHLEDLASVKDEEVEDGFQTASEEQESEREAEAKLNSDDKRTFGEGYSDYIRNFDKRLQRGSAIGEKKVEGKLADVLEANREYVEMMERGRCPDGMPDEAILSRISSEAAEKVVKACEAYMADGSAQGSMREEREVRHLSEAVRAESERVRENIYAYLAKHPTSARGEGIESDPSKALEAKARDEDSVQANMANATRKRTGNEVGDGRASEEMSFAEILHAVESGEGGHLVERDARAYEKSLETVNKIKGNKTAEQHRFFEVARSLGTGETVPLSIESEGGSRNDKKERPSFINYRAMTEDDRSDEMDLSENAVRQVTLVKSLGYILGIADWQQIVDPEQLLYEQEEKNVLSIQLKDIQGLVNLEGKMSRQEAERFVKQFDKSRDGDALRDLAANFGNQLLMRRLAGALGINPDSLYNRMETLFFCIKAFVRTGSINTVPEKFFA